MHDILRERILTGQLAPGEPLVATKLALSVGASRTPVREALFRLVTDRLVTESPTGLVVKQLTEDEIRGTRHRSKPSTNVCCACARE